MDNIVYNNNSGYVIVKLQNISLSYIYKYKEGTGLNYKSYKHQFINTEMFCYILAQLIM